MNKRYGHWTLINEEIGLCQCDCGTVRRVPFPLLFYHVSTSCGCVHSRAIDLSNQRFGKLVAIEPVGLEKGCVLWNCHCDCGNNRVFPGYLLTSGRRKSCGCIGRRTDHLVPSRTYIEGTCVEYAFSDKPQKNNSSGCKGVSKHKSKWRATITINGKTRYLGEFKEKEKAIQARQEAVEAFRRHLLDIMEDRSLPNSQVPSEK